jgi:oligopeptide transport system ATP-binding protein
MLSGESRDASSPTALVEVRDLRVYFPITTGIVLRRHVADVRAVDGVSFAIRKGETLGLVGESGCGKSTTGRALLRLTPVTGGEIRLAETDVVASRGAELRRLRRRMQMVFQDPYASLEPYMSVGSIIREPLVVHHLGSRADQNAQVRSLLATVGLSPDFAARSPQQLSGGQRQRVGLARAIALKPDLIVADEPVSALDVSIQAQILNLFQQLQREFDLTYLFIAHDLSVVRRVSNRVAVMYLGRIVEVAEVGEFFGNPLHPYSIALLSAVFVPSPRREARRHRIILKGDVPSPAKIPPGCRFHTRCWLREQLANPPECELAEPAPRSLGDGHLVECHFAERLRGAKEQVMVMAAAGAG